MQLTIPPCFVAGLAEEAAAQQYSPASQQDGEVPSPHSRTDTPLDCLTYVHAEPDQHQQQDGGGTYVAETLRAEGEYVIFNRFDEVSSVSTKPRRDVIILPPCAMVVLRYYDTVGRTLRDRWLSMSWRQEKLLDVEFVTAQILINVEQGGSRSSEYRLPQILTIYGFQCCLD